MTPAYMIDDVLAALSRPNVPELLAPPYAPPNVLGRRIGCAVPSMARHTTDEGWQLFLALQAGGYELAGRGLKTSNGPEAFGEEWVYDDLTDVGMVMNLFPGTLVLQDKREWEGKTAGPGFDRRESFTNVGVLRDRHDVFKLTVLKDAHQEPAYHARSADEIGCHAWVVYYHPRIVKHLAPYVRERHLVRTYHTVDREVVPPYTAADRRDKALLSGALSGAYPLRQRLHRSQGEWWDYRMHPGYGRTRCDTPEYLKALSHYKVAICTCSRYGYATRKIVEATACGCRVVTDLPADDVLPVIDDNLTRVRPNATPLEVGVIVNVMVRDYDPGVQANFAEATKQFYDYRAAGVRLAADIEALRGVYNG